MDLIAPTVDISDQQKQQYRDEGYFILESVIPQDTLEMLRSECARYIKTVDAEMDRQGTDVLGISHRGKRYFFSTLADKGSRLWEFLFSDLMADICRATIGPEAYLFFEQYVVKCAEVGMKFGWHQDSGYVGHQHAPYVSCWCALDDVNEDNGSVYLLPFSRAGVRQMVPHVREEGTNDLVGYFGDDPGIPVIAPAGSIAVFSSVTFHRSGVNITESMRRIYLAQYSCEPLMSQDGSGPWAHAIPFLSEGKRIR